MGLERILDGDWQQALNYFSKVPQFNDEQVKINYYSIITKEVKKASIYCILTKYKDMVTAFDLKSVSEMMQLDLNETEE